MFRRVKRQKVRERCLHPTSIVAGARPVLLPCSPRRPARLCSPFLGTRRRPDPDPPVGSLHGGPLPPALSLLGAPVFVTRGLSDCLLMVFSCHFTRLVFGFALLPSGFPASPSGECVATRRPFLWLAVLTPSLQRFVSPLRSFLLCEFLHFCDFAVHVCSGFFFSS